MNPAGPAARPRDPGPGGSPSCQGHLDSSHPHSRAAEPSASVSGEWTQNLSPHQPQAPLPAPAPHGLRPGRL
ncbi:hypothetical protein MDA_GLEAN10007438 [Myotis davidii]|uniref:Uncharacterized protein n=1 Tax=Myotis davidii TaxID=225400 RepID=L5LF06_MYODS|nr:hypothetical protein MDA_GLEAN10007438 [Myotis davidii]